MRKIISFIVILAVFLLLAIGLSKCSSQAAQAPVASTTLEKEKIDSAEVGGEWHKSVNLPDGRKIVAIPAQYKTITRKMLKSPAKSDEISIPAAYKTVSRRVTKTPAKMQERIIPAVTKLVSERVLVTPKRVKKRTVPAVTKKYVTIIPTTGKRIKKSIIIKPATVEYEIIKAVYKTINKTVVVQEAKTEMITIPATYETIEEQVLITPATFKYETKKAEFETVTEKILVRPARLVLRERRGKSIHDFTSKSELEAFLADPNSPNFKPAPKTFVSVSKTVETQPAYKEFITIPATYKTVNETVVVMAASTDVINVPATFETVTETVIARPASVDYVVVPAQYEQVSKTIVAEGGPQTIIVSRLKSPARVEERVVPAVTKQVSRRIVRTQASTVERVVPAQTRQVTRRVLSQPASTVERIVPAVTESLTTQVADDNFMLAVGGDPIFSWPASSTYEPFVPWQTGLKLDIDNAVFKTDSGADPSLMQVYDQLKTILDDNGYEHKVYRYAHGFAILTASERINEQAEVITYKNGDKINPGDYPIESLGDYMRLLFTKPKTRYRYLAFIVTAKDQTIQSTGHDLAAKQVNTFIKTGLNRSDLPNAMNDFPFNARYKCQVWIYDFARIERETPEQITENAVPAEPPLAEPKHKAGSPALQVVYAAAQE